DHAALRFAKNHDYIGFSEQELEARQQTLYPPFVRLASLRLQASDLHQGEKLSKAVKFRLQRLKDQRPEFESVTVLGPAPAPMFKLRNKYRYQCLLKCSSSELLHRFCRIYLGDQKWVPAGCKIQIDIDPMNMV
ncbi:MAG: primosomal protein N', partial [Bdellovibrionales bacterium]|nr:primosomal protein N' [Bdellovibrionales bacterium]